MVRPGAVLFLAGCPYIFGPPDMSNVSDDGGNDDDPTDGDADTDSDSDSDADGDTDEDTDTIDTDIDPILLPVVTTFDISPRLEALTIQLEVTDVQNDLDGGSLEISDGTDIITLDIPGDLDDWNGQGVLSNHVLPLDKTWLFPDLDPGVAFDPDCDVGSDLTWSLTAVDAAGHRSAPLETRLVVAAFGVLPEPDFPYIAVGVPPFVVCAEFEGATDFGRYNDFEFVEFSSQTTDTYLFELAWEKQVDLDILLYELPSGAEVYTYPDGQDFGYDPPEDLRWPLDGGQGWVAQVRYWETPIGNNDPPYLGRLLVTPE